MPNLEEVESTTGPELKGDGKIERKNSSKGNNMGAIKEMLSLYEKKSPNKGSRVESDPFPEVKWVSLSEKTRDETEIVDRAAHYIPELNLVKANRDFSGYQTVKDSFLETYGKANDKAPEIIIQSVEKQFEQQLMEVVAGANQLQGRAKWTQLDYEKAISEEALTTAVSVRSNIIERANREIRNKLRIDKGSGLNIN